MLSGYDNDLYGHISSVHTRTLKLLNVTVFRIAYHGSHIFGSHENTET